MIASTVPVPQERMSVVAVVGPTGSGKSALAASIAKALNGEIVNCDSLQVYRGFDLGTAKPSPADRARLPHHLIDIADPTEEFTAGEFARKARETIHVLTDRKKLPVVAGGTGFYLKALIDGLVEGPSADLQIRARLQALAARRPLSLHRALRLWDPPAAARIHPADHQKLIRAVEFILLRRQPLTEVLAQPRTGAIGMRVFQVGINPPRQALYQRLDARAEAMIRNGLLREVDALLKAGVPETAKPFGAIGYKQALAVLRGQLSEAVALAEMQRDTRRYAKRQWTWFRADSRVFWVSGFGDDPCTHNKVVQLLYKRWLWY